MDYKGHKNRRNVIQNRNQCGVGLIKERNFLLVLKGKIKVDK